MKVKWTLLINDAKGGVGPKHYARHIPGNGEWAAVCAKPELSKKTKKKKAAHPTCKSFSRNIAACQEIQHDPARKAIWEARYEEAKRKARRKHTKHFNRIRMLDGGTIEDPFSILSVSIEHPLQIGGT